MRPFAVVILAAGAGTRMRSSRHKVLHEAGGLPLLEHVLRAADPLSPRKVVVVVGHLGDQVREEFAQRAETGRLAFAEQRELLGTGHALLQAKDEVEGAFASGEDGSVLVLNGDGPLLSTSTLREVLAALPARAGMTALAADLADPAGLGRVVRGEGGAVERIVEQKDATPEEAAITEINAGVYAFDLGVFERCRQLGTANAAGEQYITELVDVYRAEGLPVTAVVAVDPEEVLAVNDRSELAVVDRVLRDRARASHMRAGVTMHSPETVMIDPGVTLAQDVTLHSGVHLLGATSVGEGASIGPFSVLTDCRVGSGSSVPAFTVADGASL